MDTMEEKITDAYKADDNYIGDVSKAREDYPFESQV